MCTNSVLRIDPLSRFPLFTSISLYLASTNRTCLCRFNINFKFNPRFSICQKERTDKLFCWAFCISCYPFFFLYPMEALIIQALKKWREKFYFLFIITIFYFKKKNKKTSDKKKRKKPLILEKSVSFENQIFTKRHIFSLRWSVSLPYITGSLIF